MWKPIGSFSWLNRRSADYGRRLRFVEGAVSERRKDHVGPTAGKPEQCLSVVLALGDAEDLELLVVGARPA